MGRLSAGVLVCPSILDAVTIMVRRRCSAFLNTSLLTKVLLTFISQDTFEDYLEMFIQFGYVVLFSAAFPLAGLCALLNNVVEIRSDAFKLCTNLQRPFGVRVENIGTWLVTFLSLDYILIVYYSNYLQMQ